MNIVQTTITYPPALGGLDRYVKEISEGLAQRKHHVTVVTTNLEQPLGRETLKIPEGYSDRIDVHRLPTSRIPRVGFPFASKMESVIRNCQPDLVHAHCVLHSPALFAWQVARRRRIPLVLNTIISPRTGLFWTLHGILARRIMNDASSVIAISNFERELLVKGGLSREQVTILPPGVDLTNFTVARPSIFSRYRMERNRVIVSLGRLALGKRVDRLIHALPAVLRKHPDVRVLVIGPDYGDKARLEEITKALKLDGIVMFTGALHENDVAAALQWSTAFAMTTDFELFGITLIEAMAAGAPVVAPDVASVPDVVRRDETGLLYAHDNVDDLSRSLLRLLDDDSLRHHLIDTGKREVATRFDFQRNLDALEEIYRRASHR